MQPFDANCSLTVFWYFVIKCKRIVSENNESTHSILNLEHFSV